MEKKIVEIKRPCMDGDCPFGFGSSLEDCTYPHIGCGEDYEDKYDKARRENTHACVEVRPTETSN